MSKSTNTKNTKVNNYNVYMQEVDGVVKILGAFSAPSIDAPTESWKRINGRNFARSLNKQKILIK